MPADVSYPTDVTFDNLAAPSVVAKQTRRLPLGLGLAIAACASGGLWIGVVTGVRALFL